MLNYEPKIFNRDTKNMGISQSLTPNLANIFSIKHHCVNDDCNKLAPTKAVNHNQFSLT